MNQRVNVYFYMYGFTGKQSILGIFDPDPFKLKANIHTILISC